MFKINSLSHLWSFFMIQRKKNCFKRQAFSFIMHSRKNHKKALRNWLHRQWLCGWIFYIHMITSSISFGCSTRVNSAEVCLYIQNKRLISKYLSIIQNKWGKSDFWGFDIWNAISSIILPEIDENVDTKCCYFYVILYTALIKQIRNQTPLRILNNDN